MDQDMETTVSAALARWRFIERALHSRQPWSMQYNGQVVDATRVVTERFDAPTEVVITGRFPARCLLTEDPDLVVCVMEGKEMIRVLPLDEPLSEDGAVVSVTLRLDLVITTTV